MFDLKKFKIYQQELAGLDWGFDLEQFVDADSALSQPFSIAAVMVMGNNPDNFAFNQEIKNVDLSKFDLVLLSSIEFVSTEEIYNWAAQNNITNFLLAQGSKQQADQYFRYNINDVVYRPWWAFNIVNRNEHRLVECNHRPYLFECLLGARRPHRDFAMLSFQKYQLLDSSIVTYRDIFHGNAIDENSSLVAAKFEQEMLYPYVSSNLDPAWERTWPVNHSVSSQVPWEIYNQCYYSVVCETQCLSNDFFFSEKTGKAMLGQRLFVHIGSGNFLKQLRSLGFETFEDIIDESYDSVSDNVDRYFWAFEQVRHLAKENPQSVLQKVWPKLLHNRQRMIDLQKESKQRMAEMVEIKTQSLL